MLSNVVALVLSPLLLNIRLLCWLHVLIKEKIVIGEHIIINYTIGLVKNFIKNFFYKKAQNKRIISVHRVNEKDRCLV